MNNIRAATPSFPFASLQHNYSLILHPLAIPLTQQQIQPPTHSQFHSKPLPKILQLIHHFTFQPCAQTQPSQCLLISELLTHSPYTLLIYIYPSHSPPLLPPSLPPSPLLPPSLPPPPLLLSLPPSCSRQQIDQSILPP